MKDNKDKENFMYYVRKTHVHAFRHLKLWFIPHKENNYHPHAFRPKALKAYSALLIIIKISTAAFFFSAFPNAAQFAQLTSDSMLSLTNASRSESGLSALSLHPRLVLAAESKAQDMIDKGYFSHTSPDGSRFFTWIQEAGYNYSIAGENLAMDFTSAKSAHNALMASQSHRDNILNSNYVHIGIAVKTGMIDGKNTIVLVEMFGTPYVPPTQVAVTTPEPEPTPAPTPAPTPTPTPEPTPAHELIPEATLTSQSVNTLTIQQEETADMTVTLKNTGTTTWSSDLELRLAESPAFESEFTPISIGKDVPPGEEVTLTFAIVAPETPGEYAVGFVLGDATTYIPGSDINVSLQVSQKNPVEFAYNAVASRETATPAQIALATFNPPKTTIQPISFSNEGIVEAVSSGVNRFFFGFIAFIVAMLILNIIIRMKVQHGHVIVQVAIVLAIASIALLTQFTFLEGIGNTLQIL